MGSACRSFSLENRAIVIGVKIQMIPMMERKMLSGKRFIEIKNIPQIRITIFSNLLFQIL